MKKILFTFILSLMTFLATGQAMYDYHDGYKVGFAKGCECSNTPPKLKDTYYKNGSYNDGYQAGFVDGRMFLNNNSQRNSGNDGLYRPNTQLMQQALKAKQERYDRNWQKTEKLLLQIGEKLRAIKAKQNGQYTSFQETNISTYKGVLNRINNVDWSNNSQYVEYYNWFVKFWNMIIEW